ncbi:MAG: amidohydrolase, partial [Pseudomonadales bacterium]
MDDMQAQLHVSLVQAATVWHDPVANQQQFAQRLQALTSAEPRPDLVLLPEMWSTGFTMASAEVAETMDGPSVAWMVEQAGRLDCV